jgi:transcriptional/translational regulatory protein YebC/TACO1
VSTPWEQFSAVRQALEAAGLTPEGGEVTMVAATYVPLDVDGARSVIDLVDALEDLDDVQNVYTNADIPEAVYATL